MKFSGICLITDDIPRLARFYELLSGGHPEGGDVHAELSFAGVQLAFFTRAGMEEMAPGSMIGAGYGSFTLGFEVADVDAECARLAAAGVEVVKPPATHPWGCRSAWLRDPDGNIVDLITPV
jgi:uncharacterized glyoxalase superfamily protein PhnB